MQWTAGTGNLAGSIGKKLTKNEKEIGDAYIVLRRRAVALLAEIPIHNSTFIMLASRESDNYKI